MDHTFNTILAEAVEIGNGYKEVSVTIFQGDSAYAPGTTKKVFRGYGRIDYLIHATGWSVTHVDEGIYLSHDMPKAEAR